MRHDGGKSNARQNTTVNTNEVAGNKTLAKVDRA